MSPIEVKCRKHSDVSEYQKIKRVNSSKFSTCTNQISKREVLNISEKNFKCQI